MRRLKPPSNIIVVLTQHPALGVLLMPYSVGYLPNGTIELGEHGGHLQPPFTTNLTAAEQKAIRIAASYAEKNLMKVFSRETVLSAFYKKLTKECLTKMIRPFIDKKLLEMLELIRVENIPLYQHEKGTKILFEHNRIDVSYNRTESIFHFEANSNQFHYSLQCKRDGKAVSLLEKKPVVVLTPSPASILLGNELHLFQNISSRHIIPFTNKSKVSVSASETDKYLEKVVLPILRHHDITFSGLSIFEEKRTCDPRLSVEENIYDTPVLRLCFNYANETFYPGVAPRLKSARIINDENGDTSIRYYYRDLAKEQHLAKILKETHLSLLGDSYYKLREDAPERDLTEWISVNSKMLTAHFALLDERRGTLYCLDEIRLEQNITENTDWFELHMTVVVGTFRIPFIRFKQNILQNKRDYILPDGRIILLPEEWFSRYTNLLEHSEEAKINDKSSIRIETSFIGLMESAFGGSLKKEKLSYQLKEHVKPPANLKAKLRNYQEEGFNWMLHLNKHHLGGCLADDMGLGKTLQTLSMLQHLYDNSPEEQQQNDVDDSGETQEQPVVPTGNNINRQLSLFGELTDRNTLPRPTATAGKTTPERCRRASLIVMPTSLLHNWRKEIKRFTTLRAYEFTGGGLPETADYKPLFDRYNLVLTSYGIMRNHIGSLRQYRFEYIVLDESQHIKNNESQTFKTAIQLQSNRRLILTGTPIENSLKDFWSQFHFIQPNLLGSESTFQKQFITPIKQGDGRVEAKLQQLTAPFFLRRCKRDVAPELPPLTEELIYCEMTREQNDRYEKEKNSLRNVLLELKTQQEKASNFTVLNGINQLRQLACHPQMVDKGFQGTSGKLEAIVSAFETLRSEGHKVLIFSSFVKHLKLVAGVFEANNWPYALLTGSSTNREEEIKRFADSNHIQAFLISLKAGGVGLNLTQADYVFIIDPWWNPAAELQAISRAHRIGQDKHVFAYRFITENSIEEKIALLQEEKKELFNTFITENNPLKNLSDKEWASLFS